MSKLPPMPPLVERTHIVVGDDGLARLRRARVFLAGLGGVGSYAAEALARMGIGHLTLVDHDVVSGSNLNRQLVALNTTLGQLKAEVMADRIRSINPECRLNLHTEFMGADSVPALLTEPYDFVIDAIDSLNCKTALVATAVQRGLPVASSMGAGGKLDPTRIRSGDLFDTDVCPLARQMRRRLRRRGVGRGVQAVYSTEPPRPPLAPQPVGRGRDRAVNGTVSYMPPLFGLTLAGLVIQRIVTARR